MPVGELAQKTASGVVAGGLQQLTTPEQLAQLQLIAERLARGVLSGAVRPAQFCAADRTTGAGPVGPFSEQVARAFAHELSAELTRQLGASGDGPLGQALAATSERMAAAALRGAADEPLLFSECRGPDRPSCLERRVREMSRAAGTGFSRGILQPANVWPMLAAFLLGVLVTLLVRWAWTVLQAHRVTPPRSSLPRPG